MYILKNNTPDNWLSAKLISNAHRLQWVDCSVCGNKWGTPYFTDCICVGVSNYYEPELFYKTYGKNTIPGSINYNNSSVIEKRYYNPSEFSFVDIAKLYLSKYVYNLISSQLKDELLIQSVNNGSAYVVIPKYFKIIDGFSCDICNYCGYGAPLGDENNNADIFSLTTHGKLG